MTSRIGDYDSSITEPSRRELVNIARWLQENKQRTFLVGGWAVYYFTSARARSPGKYREDVSRESKYRDASGFAPLGSKDIDMVFENKKLRESFEQGYCRKNGYVPPSRLRERSWSKPIAGTDIILDFDLLSNHRTVRKTQIGWNGLIQHGIQLEIEPGVSIAVPVKELLLLYKCVALVERTDLRGLPNQDLRYLDSKIWKDANDILALHGTGVDDAALSKITEGFGLQTILSAAKQIIESNYDNYSFNQFAFAKQFLEDGF